MKTRNAVMTNIVSAADLKAFPAYAVKVDGSTTGATGDMIHGIIYTGADIGSPNVIITSGDCQVIGGDTAIAAGSPITGGASGKVVKATIGTHAIRGYAIEACSADGATISAHLF